MATFTGEVHAVDGEHLREQGLIVPEGAVTTLLEEFRIVKRQLLVQAADLRRQNAGPMAQRVLISSPHPGEGKTYCALNLALSIAAEKESEVLLVDADFAKPSILSALGLPGGPGLMDALIDSTIDVADCVLRTDIPGLHVLPAGEATSTDSEYLSSSRTSRVLDRLTQGAPHRIVIFDSPPALAASPAAELAKYVGQVLVIVRADRTGRGALDDAITLLNACPNVQLLLNAAQFSPSGRRFGSYYGYKG
ncbi:AAA family ATPase [Novosphingobium panipatense]